MLNKMSLDLPLALDALGRVRASGGDAAIRAKMIQVLFTAPGERVHQPEFGCGLFRLVFEPQNSVLVPMLQFTVGQALARWLADDLVIEAVQVTPGEVIQIEVVYTRKIDLQQQAVRIQFK